ncbi:cytochrome P450 4c3 isoform X2 [Leptinotarsa decemlineata]|uniref:cytochrome P450 4c3 isoform X2 n=1 Tax=Leptinotarsa decemlineata TaxID=7539 RepID=UPI003D3066DB
MFCHWTTEILLSVFVSLMITYFYKNRKFYWLSWNLPGPFAFPIIGNALDFLCDDDELYDRAASICEKYTSPLRIWLGPKFVLVITDVNLAQKVMSSYKFSRKDDIYRFLETFDGKGLITSNGTKWKRDRRLMSPLFPKRNIQQYFPSILRHTKTLISILEDEVDGATINIEPFIHRCSADFVNETILGTKTKAQFGQMDNFVRTLTRMYTIIHARIVKVWLQNDYLFKLFHYYDEQERGKEVIFGFMKKTLRNAQAGFNNYEDRSFQPIIHKLLEIQGEVPNFASDEEMLHHLVTLYSAAEDTITSIVSFTLVLLGMYPNIQKKLVDEVLDVMGEDKKEIEESQLDTFEYLDMVVKDVLRLFPIAAFIVRQTEEDVRLEQWLIPKGCSVMVSIYNIHRNSNYWEKPNEFHPDHFLPDAVGKRHPFAFMPFSAGPRGCLGKSYAYMALKIMIVTILQHFHIESDGKLEDKKLKMDISIRFKDGYYPVRLRKR